MNKQPMTLKKKMLTLIAIVLSLGALAAVAFGIFIFMAISAPFRDFDRVTKAAQSNIKAVVMPVDFKLISSEKVGDPIDIALKDAGYAYGYSYKADDDKARVETERALKNAGYSVIRDAKTTLIIATNSKKNSRITAEFKKDNTLRLLSNLERT